MAFSIAIIILTLIYIVVLELSKNMLIGWLIAVFAAIAAIITRHSLSSKGQLNTRTKFIVWCAFLGILIGNYVFTAPSYKNVPAVANKNPDTTSVIHVKQGDLTGVYNEDHSVKVYAGIPYAKPPVGELRFKEPQAPESWEGVRACDEFGPMAMQSRSNTMFDSLSHILGWHDYQIKFGDEYLEAMSEDCLYLNVFAPETTDEEPLPVIFYIHGGSLTTGQSSYTEYRGEDLAKRGVIVVNFAYRLGVFGYYAADDLKAESSNQTTGNYGLLDQIAALNWVRENIASFGGDPNQITIAGESAGSSSVNALCVSPLTEGLFNYAIAESSGILAYQPFHTFRSYEEACEQGALVREEFGVSSSQELRNISAEELLTTQSNQSAMTVDGYAIIEQPYLTYEKGNNHETALLNGSNLKEADAFLLSSKATNENFAELLEPILGEYAEDAIALYPAGAITRDQIFFVDAGGEAKGSLAYIYSDAWFSYSHHVWSRYMAAQGRPVYQYFFTKTNNYLSNHHAGELPYAYGNLTRHPGLYDDADLALSEIMQSYWTNFAKTGDPNGDGLPEWPLWDPEEDLLLELNDEIRLIPNPYQDLNGLLDRYQEETLTADPEEQDKTE